MAPKNKEISRNTAILMVVTSQPPFTSQTNNGNLIHLANDWFGKGHEKYIKNFFLGGGCKDFPHF